MYIARVNKLNKKQPLKDHLEGVAKLASSNAQKIGLGKPGELLGLLHDLGKYSAAFQNYIGSATGIIEHDEDDYIDAEKLKGKIDHSTAGAKHLWSKTKTKDSQLQVAAQALALCIASHHSGLIDCINPDGENKFEKRMAKPDEVCHLEEVLEKAEADILLKLNSLLEDKQCHISIIETLRKIALNNKNEILIRFQAGLLIRLLFSCLIDADRTDTADFESPKAAKLRKHGSYIGWDTLIARLESELLRLDSRSNRDPVDDIRKQVSAACLEKAKYPTGVFTLTVPTGGGKTLASLRFALHHSKQNKLDRIIYVIPYTSIIDQNAAAVRKILEYETLEKGNIVLEHHSNLLPQLQNNKTKILSENWDSPVVFTTTVQLLETLFGGGTRDVRRMHQLVNSVIIFDEIQTLPVRTTHLFSNAVNFLTNHCGASVVLCTATQPLLSQVAEDKGRVHFTRDNEIIPDVESLFTALKRVEVVNKMKPQGWEFEEIAQLALEQVTQSKSCLVIVNTKTNAREIYELCSKMGNVEILHLSTSMCPAHRMDNLNKIRLKLENEDPIVCVSTQLIEAGVDVDFGAVIRFVAGIDSIAQAAGRCNRHGRRNHGKVFVINPKKENIDSLHDIKIGRDVSNRIFREMDDPSITSSDILHPEVMNRYFQYYFFNRADEMSYPVNIGRDDNLLNLLSINGLSVGEHRRINDREPKIYFRQAFGTAGEQFKAIDAPTQGIVIPYSQEGKKIVADLFSQFAHEQQFKLLREAQKYTVSAFPNVIKKLKEQKAICEVPEIGILVLTDPRFYHPEFGLSTEIKTEYETLIQQ